MYFQTEGTKPTNPVSGSTVIIKFEQWLYGGLFDYILLYSQIFHNVLDCCIRKKIRDRLAQTTEICFLTVLEAENLRSRCQQDRFQVRVSSWLTDSCSFASLCHHIAFPLYMCISGVSPSSYKDTAMLVRAQPLLLLFTVLL